MALEFFQYQVHRHWYRVYWGIMLGFSILFAGLTLAARFLGCGQQYSSLFELESFGLVWVGITAVYLLSFFWIIARYSLPFATLVGSMLFSFVLLSGMASVDPSKGALLYVSAWLIAIFFSGIYGLTLLVGSVFMSMVFAVLQSHFIFGNITYPLWLLLAASIVLAFLAYFFWKLRFTSVEEQKVSQLSGMLQSNRQQSEILIQSISDGIIMTDTTGKITLINPAAAIMTQWPIVEAINVDARLVAKLQNEDGSEVNKEDDPFTQAIS